jgi:hypothetical protein
MYSGQSRDRQAAVEIRHQRARKGVGEIAFASRNKFRSHEGLWNRYVVDLGESLKSQKVLSDQQRCEAIVRVIGEPDRPRLRRSFIGERRSGAEYARSTSGRQSRQKLSARLLCVHVSLPRQVLEPVLSESETARRNRPINNRILEKPTSSAAAIAIPRSKRDDWAIAIVEYRQSQAGSFPALVKHSSRLPGRVTDSSAIGTDSPL